MVGPIDLQNVVSKATPVERGQYQQQQQPLVDIAVFAQETSEKATVKEHQVQKTHQPEAAELKNDKEHSSQEEGRKAQTTKTPEKTEKAVAPEDLVPPEPTRGQHLDIKA